MEKKGLPQSVRLAFRGCAALFSGIRPDFYLASTYGSLSNVGLEHNCQRHILA